MKKIELYDILTLTDGAKYTIISRKEKDGKNYAMLMEVDEQENPIIDNIEIVELSNDETYIKKIKDEKFLQKLVLTLFKNVIDNFKEVM